MQSSGAIEVEWYRNAKKALKSLPRKRQEQAFEKVDAIVLELQRHGPTPQGMWKALDVELKGLYSVRLGRHYRMILQYDPERRWLGIVGVGPRGSIY